MPKRKKKKVSYQRLTYEQRILLVNEINSRQSSASKAAAKLNVSRQTIYNEINTHFTYSNKEGLIIVPNCKFSFTCLNHDRRTLCYRTHCPNYVEYECPKLKKFPFVCNKCPKNNFCYLEKRYYNPLESQIEAESIRKTSREKKFYLDDEVKLVDQLLSPIIRERNSLHHAYSLYKDEISVCERTVRRWIYNRALSVKAHDLPMYVVYPRSHNKDNPYKRLNIRHGFEILNGRMYKDYVKVIESYPDIGVEVFGNVFPIILTDNGTETKRLWEIEQTSDEIQTTNVFYCDPYSAWQKGSLERNHYYVRKVLPKYQTLDLPKYNDAFINNMFSHINNVPRACLEDKTPYSLFLKRYGADVLEKLNIRYIDPRLVSLIKARSFSS
jgi:IS30 family transposase